MLLGRLHQIDALVKFRSISGAILRTWYSASATQKMRKNEDQSERDLGRQKTRKDHGNAIRDASKYVIQNMRAIWIE